MLPQLIRVLERYNRLWGHTIAWLSFAMAVLTAIIVVTRYGFDLGSIALQETVLYCHAIIFMLGISYTLQRDGHVRVDIFYRDFSPKAKAWVNSLGIILFIFPFMGLILVQGWDFFWQSWLIREGSAEPGGLPLVWALKGLIPLMALNVLSQALAMLLKDLNTLTLANLSQPKTPETETQV